MARSIDKSLHITSVTLCPLIGPERLDHWLIMEQMVALQVVMSMSLKNLRDLLISGESITTRLLTLLLSLLVVLLPPNVAGPAIAILHQYAYTGQGKMIHSSTQLEWYKNDVNNRSIKVARGLQHILTNDGYAIKCKRWVALHCPTYLY